MNRITFGYMNLVKHNWILHLVIALIVMILPFVFTPSHFYNSLFDMLTNKFVLFHSFIYLLLLSFFYFHYYYILPKMLDEKKYVLYILCIVSVFEVIAMIYLFSGIRPEHIAHHHGMGNGSDIHLSPHRKRFPPSFHVTQFLLIYILGILATVYLRTRQNLKRMQEEQAQSQIQYLTSQINPHFLFNTFNSIYGLAIKEKAHQTANGMLKLSDMMRYMISETPNATIVLEQEITHIRNYIDLQKLRLASNVNLNVEISIESNAIKIAPMLLIPFIENAFKHGVNPDQESDIRIQLNEKNRNLYLHVWNKKVVTHSLNEVGFGLGIQNTQSRLQLLYPKQSELMINDSKSEFNVQLHINL
jgi:sensor histidine kinase YesM